jgi:hypothetical protein
MKTLRKQRGPGPGSIARVPGIDYGGLDERRRRNGDDLPGGSISPRAARR